MATMDVGVSFRRTQRDAATMPARIQKNARAVVRETSKDMQGNAKRRAHVITGYMRDHIKRYQQGPYKATVISEADYAIYEEYGTRYRPPHPSWRPAERDTEVIFKDRIKGIFR